MRVDAFVVDVTGLFGGLTGWLPHHSVIVGMELLHPCYAEDAGACERKHDSRYQTFATNTRAHQASWLGARHRSHARVGPKIRDGKAEGLGLLPSVD